MDRFLEAEENTLLTVDINGQEYSFFVEFPQLNKDTIDNFQYHVMNPAAETPIETYRGYDIYKVGYGYELKVDVVSPWGYSTSIEAGDSFDSLEYLKESIDDDLAQ